jgi:hypothetical protein
VATTAARNVTDRKRPSVLKNIELFYPVLISCELSRNRAPETDKSEKPQRFYDATFELLSRGKEGERIIAGAACEFSAGTKANKVKLVEIEATYFVAFSVRVTEMSEEEGKHLLKEMAETAAWVQFRALFAQIASQSGEELPLLPNLPKIRWLERDQAQKKSGAND